METLTQHKHEDQLRQEQENKHIENVYKEKIAEQENIREKEEKARKTLLQVQNKT